MVDRHSLAFCLVCMLAAPVLAQELPEDELQVNVSGYFDTFNVNIIYPSLSLTRRVSETTSLTGHYLVDMVSAASIRGGNGGGEGEGDDDNRRIDAVTSASGRGGEYPSFDDVRHEISGGISQVFEGQTISVNGIYSRENDYSSGTVAGTIARSFARKNTSLQLGFVRSWDRIFPVGKNWTRSRSVTTFSGSLSQILGKRLIVQLLYSYTNNSGYLSDGYQYLTILGTQYDPILPERRIRQAAAARANYRLNGASSLMLGYRYYWDDWRITSHTFTALYQRHLSPAVTVGFGVRSYLQGNAFFFKPQYLLPEQYMTVDTKLGAGYSNELQFTLTLDGGKGRDYLSFLTDERVQLTFSLNLYLRHTDAPDWFSRKNNLFAGYTSAGIRYRF